VREEFVQSYDKPGLFTAGMVTDGLGLWVGA
jgi:hypothetical protein